MVFDPNAGEVKLVNSESGKFLRGAASAGTGAVGQSGSSDGDHAAQRWRLVPLPQGKFLYRVEHVDTGTVLAVEGSADSSGARVHLRRGNDDPHEKWRVIPVGDDGEHALINLGSGQAVDLWDGSTDNAACFAQFTYWHGPRQRWRVRPAETRKNTRAVLTAARNEPLFLPIWLRYYSQFFAPEDIYVLDHQSSAEHLDDGSFVRIPVFHGEFGTGWHRDLVQRHQHELIDRYDVVLCADVDEIVAPDPRLHDLGTYIDRFDQDYVTCEGYELLHQRDREPAFDGSEPVLSQRSTWYPNYIYSKSLLARVPMLWHGGFHDRCDHAENKDPDLHLIHLHRMDYDLCWQRHRERDRYPRNQGDLDRGWVYQNQVTETDAFSRWFHHDAGSGAAVEPQAIPAHWRGVV